MSPHQPEQPQVLFLFSDTGGGHRSAAEAIIEALHLEFPNRITAEMVDIFRLYAPPPLNLAPDIYPPLSRLPEVWEAGYRLSNGRRRNRIYSDALWPYIYRASHRLIREHPCDLIVSVHPMTNAPVRRSLSKYHIPFVTVVTDMVSAHAFWYDNLADLIIVSTEEARQRGLKLGVKPNKIKVTGQPVADRFCQSIGDRNEVRSKLGWKQDIPIVLLIGGGEGMGPLGETAEAIDDAGVKVGMVIVTGRNQKLRSQLERREWHIPVYIYGFVTEMPDFMGASDILVTKAGPGTISEAFIAGLPIIMYSRMPGQEDGNVNYVVDHGAGIWAPKAEQVVNTLNHWMKYPEECTSVTEASKQLARPQATRQIARLLAAQLGILKD